ncbi:hypothetical protein SARC_05186 [Sphaeroforma arctica JP610]|uniref:Uncharacterized protein n=1 Tax=Sphaeroforma arctica JP610 TaxID=667725 RepID=A0A0L0G2W9_9EUKA|nr:hypothetical protein SARC_05186 [Sphaeroforma arctica JP610]KNC82538.1 hypothetical protein SARC_05186 [Sphaeroforma arctica JP610]|eukprot:XP_014156440.1 hypothetical protein SARC_05186 [Sphaeroforma arctica JP610]
MSDSARERFIAEALQKQHDIVQKVIEARNKAWAQAMNMMELKKIIQTAITHSDDSINVPKQYELLKIQNQYIEIFYQREELYCLLRMLDVRLRYHNVDTKYGGS